MSCRGETPTPPLLDGRGSPPPSCPICLGTCRNKSFTDNCLHQFCFDCLLKWSRIKAECPLCKQPFKSIIHNVRSNESFDEYVIRQQQTTENIQAEYEEYDYGPRFQYRTTLTINSRDNIALHRLLYGYSRTNGAPRGLRSLSRPSLTNYGNRTAFRNSVYQRNLWARPLPDITGRFRDTSVEYYQNNPAQLNRLVPWLCRELSVCSSEPSNVVYIVTRVTDLLVAHSINSRTFREFISQYINVNVDHFIHEFQQFAQTPFDIIGYDSNIQYRFGSPYEVESFVNEIFSSDNDDDTDEDIIMVPEVSRPSTSTLQRDLVSVSNPVIECISHSDHDDSDNEVVVVKYIKPPQERTPEVVDLVGSDSDVIIDETPTQSINVVNNFSTEFPSSSNVKLDKQSTSRNMDLIKFQNMPSTSGLGQTSSKPTIFLDSDSDTDTEVKLPDFEKYKYFKSRLLKDYDAKSPNFEKYKYFKTRILKENKNAQSQNNVTDMSSSSTSSSDSSPVHSNKYSNSRKNDIKKEELIQNYMNSTLSEDQADRSGSIRKKSKASKKSKHKKSKKKSSEYHSKKYKHKSKSKKKSKSRERFVDKHRKVDKKYKSINPIRYWPRDDTLPVSSMAGQSKLKSVVNSVAQNEFERPSTSRTRPDESPTQER